MMKKRIISALLVGLTVVGISTFKSSAYVDYVTASISSNQTGADSSRGLWNCQDYLELSGTNQSNSTEELWVEAYEQKDSAIDRRENGILLNKGASNSYRWLLAAVYEGKNYYLHLDPDGTLHTGCNGSGTLYD